MRYQVKRISIHQTSKTMGLLYAFFGLIFLPFGIVVSMMAPEQDGPSTVLWLLFPILYGVVGYVMVAIGTAIYNLIAGWAGGVEADLEPPAV